MKKTFDNLINETSEKYLFTPRINIDGFTIRIVYVRENEDFPELEPNTIYIKIVSIQSLTIQLDRLNIREGRSSLDNLISENIALLVDEAHHFNANASIQKVDKDDNPKAFENTMDTIRNSVLENGKYVIQLEFTATLPFGEKGKEKKLRDKYLDKLLFNYTLKDFVSKNREGLGGYGKHLSQIEANETIESKMLTGILINQYRKFLAIKSGFINFKPVILFKSNSIKFSFEAQKIFENLVENLTVTQVNNHVEFTLRGAESQAINWFVKFYDSLEDKEQFIQSLKEDFLGHILNANDDDEERIINNLNTLEQIDNPFRAVFAVEKVSEGWDVLNLYDIVRVNERGQKANTNAEAQLVGRGSRYYPLVHRDGKIITKQYFDATDERIMLETFHYHTIQDPKYLEELSASYSALGIPIELDKPPKIYRTSLKTEFKDTYAYKFGFFVENLKKKPNKEEYVSLRDYGFQNGFKYRVIRGIRENQIFNEQVNKSIKVIPKKIERKYIIEAMSRIPYYRFNIMKKDMPMLKSKKEFIEGENWLGSWDHMIEFNLDKDDELTAEDILRGTIEFLTNLSMLIHNNFMKETGTKQFIKIPISERLVDYYERSYKVDSNAVINIDTINAKDKKWSPYDYIIGDDLERKMVELIENNILSELEEKYERVYLIRNDEVYNKIVVNEFNGTRRYLPDFILYLLHKDTSKVTQIYLEPKGENFINKDGWKQKILEALGKDAEIVMDTTTDEFELFGVRFFTGNNYEEFDQELREKTGLPAYQLKLEIENN